METYIIKNLIQANAMKETSRKVSDFRELAGWWKPIQRLFEKHSGADGENPDFPE